MSLYRTEFTLVRAVVKGLVPVRHRLEQSSSKSRGVLCEEIRARHFKVTIYTGGKRKLLVNDLCPLKSEL